MRHSKVINHLGRTSSHRKAMLANMATSLILHKRITTTTAKAKALRTYVEPLITKSKEDSTHSRRVVFSYLKDKTAVAELFRDISPKIGERPGGYTRILKLGNRIGDNADMCILELVDYNEAMLGGDTTKTKTTRRRRSTKKKEEAVAETATHKTPKAKAVKSEAPVKETGEAEGKTVPEE
jgi:large subunit ribosomal protein L17